MSYLWPVVAEALQRLGIHTFRGGTMRTVRALVATLLAAVLGLGAAFATTAPAQAQLAKPKRTIVEKDPNDISFFKFRLKGKITQVDPVTLVETPYAKGKVKLMKKACKKCKWKQFGKFKTTSEGKFRTVIFAPKARGQRWKWQVKVPASDRVGVTKGTVWTTGKSRG